MKSSSTAALRPRSLGCDHVISLQCTQCSSADISPFEGEMCTNNETYCVVVANRTRILNALFFSRSAVDGGKTWQNQERLPACNLRTLLSHYLDITTTASQTLLALLAAHASSEEDKRCLQLLATVFTLPSPRCEWRDDWC